jgi:glycolate oxidase FAD binding subunit
MAAIPAQLASACAAVRDAGPADQVAGVQPRYVAAPASTAEASAVLRAAAELDLAVLPRGAGTRIAWGAAPASCDLVVDMKGMDRLVEHAAGDLVATVQAGASLAGLGQALGRTGQRLALDPAGPAGTVGGLIATGAAGPLRLRYGSPRDLLIGITVVRADGTVASSGGKVVKNVAGYDLGKLYAGSYGTLGLITEATFRLHPRPAAVAYVTADCAGQDEAHRLIAAAVDSPLTPSAAEISWPAGHAPIRAGILLEGDQAGTAERAARLCGLLDELAEDSAVSSPDPPPWWGTAPDGDGTALRIAFWPGQLPAVLGAIRAAAAAAGLDPAVAGSAGAGVLTAGLPGQADPAAVAKFVTAVRESLAMGPAEPTGLTRASAVVLHAPAGVRDLVDMWGPAPSLALMRAVKDQFDPEHRMAPGRLAGGI